MVDYSKLTRLFKLGNPVEGKWIEYKEIQLDSESNLRRFLAPHLQTLFGVELIQEEFNISDEILGSRFDSLGYDKQKKCLVVIEYKIKHEDRIYKQMERYDVIMKDKNKRGTIMYNIVKTDSKYKDYIIDWDKTYFIYCSPQIKEDDMQLLRNRDNRVIYKLRFYDGTMLLDRLDNNDIAINIDGEQPKPPSKGPMSGWKPIQDVAYETGDSLPIQMSQPDGSVVDVEGWTDVLKKAATWLIQTRRITKDTVPIPSGKTKRAKIYLLNTELVTIDGAPVNQSQKRHYVEIQGLWLYKNYPPALVLEKVIVLSNKAKLDPNGFKIKI